MMDTTLTPVLQLTRGHFVKHNDKYRMILSADHHTTASRSKEWYSDLRLRDLLNDDVTPLWLPSKTGFLDRVDLTVMPYHVDAAYPLKSPEHFFCVHLHNDDGAILELDAGNGRDRYKLLVLGLEDGIAFDAHVAILDGADSIISVYQV